MKPKYSSFNLALVSSIIYSFTIRDVDSSKFRKLSKLNVEPDITISGLSGGGSLASMLMFIYPSFIKGAGIFAGAPMATGIILVENPVNFFNFTRYAVWVEYLASRGWIDDPRHLRDDFRAYIFHGGADQIVPHFLSRFNIGLLKRFGVPSDRILDMIGQVPASHCIPSSDKDADELNLRICSIGYYFAVCACGYSGVNHMYSHLFPETYVDPRLALGEATSGQLFKFDQHEFFPGNNASHWGFKEFGYAYIPINCRPETGIKCKLHFAFHGCGQNIVALILKRIPEFISETGYLEAADANNIVTIFPQAFPDLSGHSLNYIGCFDLYSYTSPFRILFSTKWGAQPLAIKRMYERIHLGAV